MIVVYSSPVLCHKSNADISVNAKALVFGVAVVRTEYDSFIKNVVEATKLNPFFFHSTWKTWINRSNSHSSPHSSMYWLRIHLRAAIKMNQFPIKRHNHFDANEPIYGPQQKNPLHLFVALHLKWLFTDKSGFSRKKKEMSVIPAWLVVWP